MGILIFCIEIINFCIEHWTNQDPEKFCTWQSNGFTCRQQTWRLVSKTGSYNPNRAARAHTHTHYVVCQTCVTLGLRWVVWCVGIKLRLCWGYVCYCVGPIKQDMRGTQDQRHTDTPGLQYVDMWPDRKGTCVHTCTRLCPLCPPHVPPWRVCLLMSTVPKSAP